MRKILMFFVVLAFVGSSLVLTSCAKKQIQVSEGTKAAVEAVKKAEPTRTIETTDPEAEKKKEAERQAKLRELEAAQKLADQIRVFESEHIYFDFDKSDLKHYAMVILKDKAGWLQRNPSYAVNIEGHCDERGTNEYNLALGERRAQAAKKYLTSLGITEDRLSTISYGEEKPADPGHSEDAWAKNRRDEFKLMKK